MAEREGIPAKIKAVGENDLIERCLKGGDVTSSDKPDNARQSVRNQPPQAETHRIPRFVRRKSMADQSDMTQENHQTKPNRGQVGFPVFPVCCLKPHCKPTKPHPLRVVWWFAGLGHPNAGQQAGGAPVFFASAKGNKPRSVVQPSATEQMNS